MTDRPTLAPTAARPALSAAERHLLIRYAGEFADVVIEQAHGSWLTAAGGRRIVRTVSSRFYRGGLLDGLAAQSASAAVILGAASLGAPVSTSTVVASGMIGVGAARRRRHVHWPTVRTVVSAWVITVPACAVLGAGLVELGQLVGALR